MEITGINDIQELVVYGFLDWKSLGEVGVDFDGDLAIFNYTPKAQYEGRWNVFECVSRGLILNIKTGEVIARPFDRFWNWLEGGRCSSGHIVNVTEKIDGSMGTLYRVNGEYHIATRGAFHSEQAEWATKFINANFELHGLPTELTLVFEIVYPENRIVLDYGNRQDIVLLAARNRFTGEFLPFFPNVYEMAYKYGFSLPRTFQFNDIVNIIEKTGAMGLEEGEGFVVEFSDGQRFKFKADRYLELHRLISRLSYKSAVLAVFSGNVEEYRQRVPEEFLGDFNGWVLDVEKRMAQIRETITEVYGIAPKETRKDFAIWSNKNHRDIAPYLFAMLDNKPIEPLMLRMEFSQ